MVNHAPTKRIVDRFDLNNIVKCVNRIERTIASCLISARIWLLKCNKHEKYKLLSAENSREFRLCISLCVYVMFLIPLAVYCFQSYTRFYLKLPKALRKHVVVVLRSMRRCCLSFCHALYSAIVWYKFVDSILSEAVLFFVLFFFSRIQQSICERWYFIRNRHVSLTCL